ncbi:hypothetical protein J7F03_20670 [Streptomyces sp. ISL-43]|uniref:hypothetical protein n=1 Tax=Streptomyces sp. ISL-43 TaxID=2819183 RepID=UPI001BE74059|nr:hypothetical protein [Streptomyces sp. ISL-43]MBT2449457.1 hypothetical protein [Streptomyces sp. ISL-43]
MSALPPFSGDEPTCAKCGHKGASTEYLAFGDCHHAPRTGITIGWHANQRLHRECGRCGHQWDEATVPPVHLGNGANAEDCPACHGTNPPYPFICPGETPPEPTP